MTKYLAEVMTEGIASENFISFWPCGKTQSYQRTAFYHHLCQRLTWPKVMLNLQWGSSLLVVFFFVKNL